MIQFIKSNVWVILGTAALTFMLRDRIEKVPVIGSLPKL